MFRTWNGPYLTNVDMWRTGTGLHAIVLTNGCVVMAHNTPEGRDELVLSVSNNRGESFQERVITLESDDGDYRRTEECINPDDRDDREPNEFTYPTLMQSRFDGMIHVVYTYSYFGASRQCGMGRENIKHVVFSPDALDPWCSATMDPSDG